ncbi:MAG TPA: cytochrome ubiquinol oxidase subunit I [Chloroflexota bacterium]|nr:cytochrome ubiquinol oxidase subunit I [Chloroflexota bacterium]
MDPVSLSRLQFAVTTIYHFFFVPLTIGLGPLVAVMHTLYFRTGKEVYKRATKFWGTLFLINFAMGVVTGIVQEFQFGLNWAGYSRFMGDIFGAPLAIEALLAFFLESVFLGVWIFGWDRLPRGLHLASIWLVAIGAVLSAFWILVANSFMQNPVGYALRNNRAEMTDFVALITNPNVQLQFPHVVAGGICTGAFFVLGVSAYHLWRKRDDLELFQKSFRVGAVAAIVGTFLVIPVGHAQGQRMIQTQPMKMAAAEALWETEDPAALSIFTWGDEVRQRDVFAIRLPAILTVMSFGELTGEVKGIRSLQQEYEQQYGPGNYVPSVILSYWSFRAMVGAGILMLLLAIYALFRSLRGNPDRATRFLPLLVPAIVLPYLANSTGWILTEMGRQPWIVFGLMKTENGISPNVTPGMVLFSLIGFTLVYGTLMAADVYLLWKYGSRRPDTQEEEQDSFAGAY